jgi:Helicase associated domain
MWSIERIRRENLAIQTAIRNQSVSGGDSRFPVGASEHNHSGNSNFSVLSSRDVEALLTLHSQNALNQHLQNQQLATIRASLLAHHTGISTTSTSNLRNEVTAALCHPLSNKKYGTKANATLPNSSRLIQIADSIKSSLVQGSRFNQDTSHLALLSSLHPSRAKQQVPGSMKHCSNAQDHTTRVMEKARAASFAPVRKKSKDSCAKSSSMNQGVDSNNVFLQMEKKPSKNFAKWNAMLESLKRFRESYGHCIVPRGYEDMKLASWVSCYCFIPIPFVMSQSVSYSRFYVLCTCQVVEQRKQYRRYQENLSCGIDQDRIDRLNEIGFTWDAQEAAWDRQMDHLREFHRIHGHCDVPRDDVQFPRLYLWIREQRRHYKLMEKGQSTLLTKARLDALNSVGFSFDSLGVIFSSRLQELSEFRRVHGHCHVPPDYSQNAKLFGWIQRMKKEYKLTMSGQSSTLSDAHICAMNELEFPWPSGKKEGCGPCARSALHTSVMSSDSEKYEASPVDDEESSVLSSSSGSLLEVERTCARPLKKRRLLD